MNWAAGDGLMQATAIAPSAVWQKHADQVFALLNGRPGERKIATPKSAVAKKTPAPATQKVPTTPPALPPSNTPALVVSAVVKKGTSAAPGANVQTDEAAGGALKIRHDNSWQLSESGTSYAALAAAEGPDLTVWIDWQDAKNQALDAVTKAELQKLRGRYERLEELPNRTIAGQPASQVAWLTGNGGEGVENLEFQWIHTGRLFRATISAAPPVWKKEGGKVLRLLDDLGVSE
jgi:hypothetical protein